MACADFLLAWRLSEQSALLFLRPLCGGLQQYSESLASLHVYTSGQTRTEFL